MLSILLLYSSYAPGYNNLSLTLTLINDSYVSQPYQTPKTLMKMYELMVFQETPM